jgi:hypothetical protein
MDTGSEIVSVLETD